MNQLAVSVQGGESCSVKGLAEVLVHTTDRSVRKTAVCALSSLKHPGCIDTFCRYIMESEAPELQEIALNAGFLPSGPADRELFRFVTGQYTLSENSDADFRLHLLTRWLRDTPWTVRNRVFSAALQQIMIGDLLSVMLSDNAASPLFSKDQWDRLAGVLCREGRHDDLARVMQTAPLPVSVKPAAGLAADPASLPAPVVREMHALRGHIPPEWTWPEPRPLLYRSLAGPGS